MTKFWADLTFYLLVGLLCVMPVFMVAFATIRYGINRFRPRQAHPKRWATLTAILATPLLCWAGFHSVLFYLHYYPYRSFNSNDWVSNQSQRYEMVAELRASRRLIGLKPAQVSALLGPAYHQDKTSWSYHLGIKPGLGFSDGETLVLEFRNNQVVGTRTYQN